MDYSEFYRYLAETPLAGWAGDLPDLVSRGFSEQLRGEVSRWREAVERLPEIRPANCDFSAGTIRIGTPGDCDDLAREQIKNALMALHPWRKGPFNVFGLHIDTEWRSDWKWKRLEGKIADLNNRLVLDVGCGSGYYCWRMLAAGARCVVGIDPLVLYPLQFAAIQKYARQPRVAVLPLSVDDLPENLPHFDTVFSMGLLYHRRSPLEHLLQLNNWLRPGGELVLETLVIEGGEGSVLSPAGRYAMMPNVWFIPSVPTLESWLRRVQYENVRCVDVNVTTTQEQRSTAWMGFQSLADFLDPLDPARTIEGYPAPRRAVILANKP